MKKILLIGGDSRLAKNFFKKYKDNKSFKIFRTTRRLNKKNYIFLNFSDISKYHNYEGFNIVIIIGGVVDYNECEKNYDYAKKVNCFNIPELAKNFLANFEFDLTVISRGEIEIIFALYIFLIIFFGEYLFIKKP